MFCKLNPTDFLSSRFMRSSGVRGGHVAWPGACHRRCWGTWRAPWGASSGCWRAPRSTAVRGPSFCSLPLASSPGRPPPAHGGLRLRLSPTRMADGGGGRWWRFVWKMLFRFIKEQIWSDFPQTRKKIVDLPSPPPHRSLFDYLHYLGTSS